MARLNLDLKEVLSPEYVWQRAVLPPGLGGRSSILLGSPVCSRTFCSLEVLHLLPLCLRMPILGQVRDLTPPPSDQCPHYCLFYDLFKESSFQRTAGKEVRKGRGR